MKNLLIILSIFFLFGCEKPLEEPIITKKSESPAAVVSDCAKKHYGTLLINFNNYPDGYTILDIAGKQCKKGTQLINNKVPSGVRKINVIINDPKNNAIYLEFSFTMKDCETTIINI